MTEVPIRIRTEIISQKLQLWQNAHYSAELDARIAQSIEDTQMLEQAKTNMKRALQVIGQLEEFLTGLAE